jgi:hypothetical protein
LGKVVYRISDFEHLAVPVDSGAQLWTYVAQDSVSYMLRTPKGKWLAGAMEYGDRLKWFDAPFSFLPDLLKKESRLFSHFGHSTFAIRGVPFVVGADDANNSVRVGINDSLHRDVLPDIQSSLTYALPSVFVEDLSEFYHSASVVHSMSVLINEAFGTEHQFPSRIHMVLSEGLLEIAAVSSGQLLHANHYRWQTESDIMYFIAAVIEMLPKHEWTPRIYGMSSSDEMVARLLAELFPAFEATLPGDADLKLMPLKMLSTCAS